MSKLAEPLSGGNFLLGGQMSTDCRLIVGIKKLPWNAEESFYILAGLRSIECVSTPTLSGTVIQSANRDYSAKSPVLFSSSARGFSSPEIRLDLPDSMSLFWLKSRV